MATLRDIKRKIGSINSTQTITRTMKMVSAAKLRRAQDDLAKIKDYAIRIEELTGRVIKNMPGDAHPLIAPRENINRVLLVAIGSDRGLCGAFNVNIGLHVQNFIQQNHDKYEEIGVYVFGRKVRDYLQRRKVEIIKDWTDIKRVDQELVDVVSGELIDLYLEGRYDKIFIIYTYFKSAVKQEIVFDDFVPIKTPEDAEYIDYLAEPERIKIVETLVPKYIGTKLYYSLVESQTSEHAARMSAMENATSNCGEMVRYLTLVYNKRRQESITNEMMDIVGGAEALRGT
ncbi:MAG TPA: ATP synthase F1 subunit gamma [Syntrophorhabdaceae bacterium]|nr:ATP synthase F1 subunit gamma [Syntrophorhabdaceae bacterium]